MSSYEGKHENSLRASQLKLLSPLQLFLIMLILSWLQAADKLLNPFGRDKGYDVDLEEWLDSSLWRSSKTIQQQDLAAREGKLLFLDLQ